MRSAQLVVLVGLVSLLGATDAHAYLDPGTGSMIIQILIASFIGAAVFLRRFWTRIAEFFNRYRNSDTPK